MAEISDCVCGHALEEHDPRSRSCEADDCLCGCYEQDEDDDA